MDGGDLPAAAVSECAPACSPSTIPIRQLRSRVWHDANVGHHPAILVLQDVAVIDEVAEL
jgi:hypothetical protein